MDQLLKKFNIKECKIVLERKNFNEFLNRQGQQKRKKDSDIVRDAKKICLQPERLTERLKSHKEHHNKSRWKPN